MWALNVWIYLVFCFNPGLYQSLKATGQYPCYVYVQDAAPGATSGQDAAPACFYDPSAY